MKMTGKIILLLSLLIIFLTSSVVQGESIIDECTSEILRNSENIPNSSFQSSSNKSPDYSAHQARYSTANERAWCPSSGLSNKLTEYLEINLRKPFNLASMMVLIKSFNDNGRNLMPNFVIEYKREPEGPWYQYTDSKGNCTLEKPSQIRVEAFTSFSPSFIATSLRIYPFIESGIGEACIMIELFGCQTNVLEYIIPKTRVDENDWTFSDQVKDASYDAKNIMSHQSESFQDICHIKSPNSITEFVINQKIYQKNGLGQLTDKIISTDPSSANYEKFVGWFHESDRETFTMLFRLSKTLQINKINIHFAGPKNQKAINYPYDLKAYIYQDFYSDPSDLLMKNTERYSEINQSFQNSDWFHLKGGKDTYGNLLAIKVVAKAGWTLIDEVTFDTEKAVIPLTPTTEVYTVPSTEPQMFSDIEIFPEVLTEQIEESVSAPFGQFAVTAIMIICGFGIFLILSTIFACFMIRSRRSSVYKHNVSSEINNCDSFTKLNTSQQQNAFTDLMNQQQSLMGISQGTGSTTMTNNSLIDSQPHQQGFLQPQDSYLTLSPQQQHLLMLMSTNQFKQNARMNQMSQQQQNDSSSTLYASIQGEGGESYCDENNAMNLCNGTMSPGNMRSASNMPLPNTPISNSVMYGGNQGNNQTSSLAQAQLLSQGNFHILSNHQNPMTINRMNMFPMGPPNSHPPVIQPPPQPYFSYLQGNHIDTSSHSNTSRSQEDSNHT